MRMRIRLNRQKRSAEDAAGPFSVIVLDWGPLGPSLTDLSTYGVSIPRPTMVMAIAAVHGAGRERTGTRLCRADFESADAAMSAIETGFDVLPHKEAESFVTRAIAAGVAEVVK